jgi:ABC-type lipoprotein export system ATPase subunit
MDITFNNLIEALIDNKELILSDDIIDNIDDNVLDEVFNQFCRDLSYG